MPQSPIPASMLRSETVMRTIGGRSAPVRSCGFMLKPTSAGGYSQRIMRDGFIVVYLMRGTGTLTHWKLPPRRMRPGDMALMVGERPHGIQQDADGQWAEAYITMDGTFGRQLTRLGVLNPHLDLIHPGVNLSLVEQFNRIHDSLSTLPDYALPSVLLLAHELLQLAMQLHRKTTLSDDQELLIERACFALSQNLQAPLEIEQLASELGLSYERFRKLFRQRVGVAPGDYRIRRRIDRARALIWQHDMSNKQVAYELGYPDPFTFSKQFRKFTGLWPAEYRKRLATQA